MFTFTEFCQTVKFFDEVIRGKVKSIKTLGIITAENPNGNKLTVIGNERKNKELLEELEKNGFAPVQIRGKFNGMSEKPFLVLNITKDRLLELAKKYKQQAVVYAEWRKDKLSFTMIGYFVVSGKKFNVKLS